MYVIGFYKIKKIAILLYAIVFVAVINLGCSLFDKDVNCKAKLILMIINNTTSAKNIKFSNFKENYRPDYVTITFSDSSASMGQQECRTFSFEYTWIDNNECVFSKEFFERYRIDVNVQNGDTILAQYQEYPFDTTTVFQNICTNCTHEYIDTLVLK